MRNRVFIWAFIAICASSCSLMEDDGPFANQFCRPFYASIEQPSPVETKVYADEDLILRWDAEDLIVVFNKYSFGFRNKYKGDAGSTSGPFVNEQEGSFVVGDNLDYVCAVYPYIQNLQIYSYKEENYIQEFPLPAVQTYRENSLGRGANTMISMGKDENLAFKNVCGYLALKVYGGNVTVSSITLKGNNSEMIAGKADIDVSLDAAPSLRRFVDGKYSITLECEDVKVGNTAETATVFWLVVPPTKFEKGFTVTVEYNDEKEFVQTTSRSIEIKRSCLSRMVAFEVK